MPKVVSHLLSAVSGFVLCLVLAGVFGWFSDEPATAAPSMPPAASATSAAMPPATDYPYATFLQEQSATHTSTEGLSGWEEWTLENQHVVTVAPQGDGTALVKSVNFSAKAYQLPAGGASFSCTPLRDVEVRGLDELIAAMDLFRQDSLLGKVQYTQTDGIQMAGNDQVKCFIG